MKDKIEDIKTEVEEKSSDFTSHKDQKGEIRKDLEDLISDCEQLYNDYDKARMQVRKKIIIRKLLVKLNILIFQGSGTKEQS